MNKMVSSAIVVLLISVAGLTLIVGYQLYKFTRHVEVIELSTLWTEEVDKEAPLPEYPRPQLRRDSWQSLNGLWQYKVTPREAPMPVHFDGNIVVPFAIESRLSGVQRKLLPEDRLWYRRVFEAPPLKSNERLMLHFGAVDWEAEVWLNGARIGVHCSSVAAHRIHAGTSLSFGLSLTSSAYWVTFFNSGCISRGNPFPLVTLPLSATSISQVTSHVYIPET